MNNETTLPRPVRDLISVIVTTYNREDALVAVLRGLARQTDPKFEVIVADDGSPPSTACAVAAWRPKFERLAHVWHEHKGFRAAEIRNRAILESFGEICIFLDGDEILYAAEGDTLKRRYKVIRIMPTSVLMEDTESKHQQPLPLVEESQS